MRLTLRTLLSYLDNVLEEPARAELQRQIESSEHAGEWLHRTRDVMRRLKLGAPEVGGAGLVDDPNTVAEYLDRTLPEQSVAEFERVCLESDAMLAEIAACHQVLARFLHEPAEIDPDTRRRLHRLQADLDEALSVRPTIGPAPPAEPEPPEPAPAEPVAPLPSAPEAPEPHVPDYLRSANRREWIRWAPAIAALLLLVLTSIVAFGPGGPLSSSSRKIAAAEQTAADQQSVEPPETLDASQDVEDQADPVAAAEPSPPAEAPAVTPSDEVTDVEEEPVSEIPAEAPASPPGDEAEGVGDQASGELEMSIDPEPDPVEPVTIKPSDLEPETPPAPRLLGDESTLIVEQVELGGWRRLASGEEVVGTARLITLPDYRAVISVSTGVQATLVGPADVVVTAATGASPAAIDLRFGRLLLENTLSEGEPLELVVAVDETPHTARLSAGAALAIAADRFYLPGWPNLETPAPMIAVANALRGVVEWSTRGEEIRIAKPKRWYVVESDEAPAPDGFGGVEWVESSRLGEVRERAAIDVAAGVDTLSAVWPQLQQVAEGDRFRENRELAAACSLALGHPDTLIEAFRDAERQGEWRNALGLLRQAASRSVEGSTAIARVFREKFGPQKAAELVELVTGFTPDDFGRSPEEVSEGVAAEVVLPALSSEDLATRVLGSLILEELVGPLERPYRPLDSERRRITAIRRLESLLERGELTARQP